MTTAVSAQNVPGLPSDVLDALARDFAPQVFTLAEATVVSAREIAAAPSGVGEPVVVALHGIGSGSASWFDCAQAVAKMTGRRFLAWDAPGYGASTPLESAEPRARDYAARLEAWLACAGVSSCVLVGHSLGALMASAYAALDAELAARGIRPARLKALVFLSPARGYGALELAADRVRVREMRLRTLAELGISGMAAQRSGRLLSRDAGDLARAWVYWNMARLHEFGYRQAVELLTGDDLLAYLRPLPAVPLAVWCGVQDVVTTPAKCAVVAATCQVPLELIDGAGHACYVEQPAAVVARLAKEIL